MRPVLFRLSVLMWLVALVAAFLGGMRYGEYREAANQARNSLLLNLIRSSNKTLMATSLVTFLKTDPDAPIFADGGVLWSCPHCGNQLEALDGDCGQPHACPKCGGRSTVPE